MLQRCIAKLVLIGAGQDETGIVGYLLRLLEEVVKTCFDARPVAAEHKRSGRAKTAGICLLTMFTTNI
jgi:hypothetical protein